MPIQDNDNRSNDKNAEVLLRNANEYFKTLGNENKLKEYLNTSALYRYSPYNTVLIKQQMPAAMQVMSQKAWAKLGRKIVDEKGITILAPRMEERKVERKKLDPKTKQPILGENGLPYTETVTKKELVGFDPITVYDVSQTSGALIKEKSDYNLETLYAALCSNDTSGDKEKAVKSELKALAADKLKLPIQAKGTDGFKLQCAYYEVCSHYGLDTSDITLPIADSKIDFSDPDKVKNLLDTVGKGSAKVFDDVEDKCADISFDISNQTEHNDNVTPEEKSEAEWDAASQRVYNAVKSAVEKPGVFFIEETTKPASKKETLQAETDISEIRGKSDKSIADYVAIYKSLQQKQNQTMMFYKGFAAQKLDRLAKRVDKQEKIEIKIRQCENKAAKLENKAARLSDTNKMLSSLFADKKIPAVVGFIMERNENRIAKLQDKRIPKSNQKLQTLREKSARNHLKMEHIVAKVDKVQALSSVIRSFSVLNPTTRREQFRAAMDDLHNASERAVQCKIDKCELRIAKLQNTLPENQLDYSISNINTGEKITALTEKRTALVQKMEKLQGLQKPFAELDDNKSDQLISDVKEQVGKTAETVENEKDCTDMAEDIAVYATEKATELQREDVSRDEASKSPGKEHRKLPLSEQIDKARAENPRTDAPKQDKQQTKKQEQNL